ncbi:MAG: heavy metal-associated domain-containing protein [Nitrososphaerales archaeon]
MSRSRSAKDHASASIRIDTSGLQPKVRRLKRLDGVQGVEIDYLNDVALVRFDPAVISLGKIREELEP